jgi:hypothetical protein
MKKYLSGGDVKQVRGIADEEANKRVLRHEKEMHKGVKKMKAGGPTSMDRKMMGRNMSRVNNQRGR